MKHNVGSIGTLQKYHKLFEIHQKMKEAKQATTKTSFLTLSVLKISNVMTATVPKDEGDYEVND